MRIKPSINANGHYNAKFSLLKSDVNPYPAVKAISTAAHHDNVVSRIRVKGSALRERQYIHIYSWMTKYVCHHTKPYLWCLYTFFLEIEVNR